MNIAIIPARAGSKRIKNKNIKLFCGKPIIYYSIIAAKKSNIFNKIIVSTDSLKIKKISEKYGADVPFIRPKNLSDDFTSTMDVVKHSIKEMSYNPKNLNICCIYPTAPLIKQDDLIKSYKNFQTNMSYNDDKIIVELKTSANKDLDDLIKLFPFQRIRFSKYCNGIGKFFNV